MRTYLYLFYIAFLTSCSSFLEVDPKTSVSGENIINDETSANAAINGVYAALRDYYSVNYQSIAYLSGDNVQWTGSQSLVQEFINHRVNAENATLSSTWVDIYKTINRANNVIKALRNYEGDRIPTSVKDNVLGQAYAIRGLAYFDLVRVWGGVPLVTEPTEKVGDNVGIARSTATQTYQQVIDDLNLAEDLLPSTTNRFVFTKKTVWALKARYYLYQEKWEQARDYAKLLIDDQTNYELLTPYFSFFKNNVTGTRESVLELFYSANEVNAHRLQWQPQTNGGTRQWAPSEALIVLLTNPATAGARSQLIARDNQDRWYGDLYYRSTGADPTYIIRIAELYLIRAEAYAALEEYNLAVDDLNKVRGRALLTDKPNTTDKGDILTWIEEERRLEFAFEAHRWFDLVRTGRAQQVLGISESFRLLLPIPYSQRLADPVIAPNPGYSS
ncbi:RagB/SusD family nutrient uptake outer membrane protein [Sphingobacterium pedocola]|uniref:RagB/SusD family nutrient uptake outer membrane protein n=1 Tax=Sphingobacterium pedocola TaxID=2082722 RepID=A0ABR9T279_9SPHI|nr:RagB/SusD family nutrient uptake outer membrane protein [Sphingobacterium pedocola]MBE8719444.1 RagB/SusD family nutrient uptake outer membrane protein [Sphingobacterium pedocola]